MPPNINWEYMIHDTTLALSSHVSFEWRMSDRWTPCDKRCHGYIIVIFSAVGSCDTEYCFQEVKFSNWYAFKFLIINPLKKKIAKIHESLTFTSVFATCIAN